MATRTNGRGGQGEPEVRRGPEPASYLPRTAGLYSEVTWDRNWSSEPRRPLPASEDADAPPPPAE